MYGMHHTHPMLFETGSSLPHIHCSITVCAILPLHYTGTNCASYSRADGTEKVTIYLLGSGVEVEQQSFYYRV